jgi:GDSL-like Lipase/Acylhydrolase
MAADTADQVPDNSPPEVKQRAATKDARVPVFDPTVGVPLATAPEGEPRHRLVVIGDSLSHGFQSGAIFNTDISYPAIIAYELGWPDFRFPRYPGVGGLPLNVEYLLRDLEHRYGTSLSFWEVPLALFRARGFMDEVEDYWERGAGLTVPALSTRNHALAVYGWDLRDALSKSAKSCRDVIKRPNDDVLNQIVENNGERAALRVYPNNPSEPAWEQETLFDAAAALGEEKDDDTDCGIETLIVFLGANNALKSVTDLKVSWSEDDGFQDMAKKNKYTVWQPAHFKTELAAVVEAVKNIKARHVILCTVPHVTVAPIARGVGSKIEPRSRYFPYYTRPWIGDDEFDKDQDPHLTAAEARAVDYAIDEYNDAIETVVREARTGSANDPARDWYLMDIAGFLDRLAARRYITDVNARPPWWTQYPLPARVAALRPTPDSRFTVGDGRGGRGQGGLFSLDGVHPTTVGYGIVAQEMINIMRLAGVEFRTAGGAVRPDPVTVDFDRLIRRDTLVRTPPQILTAGVEILGWADDTLDWVKRALSFRA